MRISTNSILLGLLATINTISYAQGQTTAAAAATTSAAVCKRDFEAPEFLVVRDHQWGKRIEKNIPGTNPLVSALKNIPKFAGSAKGVVTNRLAHGNVRQHSMVTGLYGALEFTGQLIIDGQRMVSPMPWIIRWDYDPQKLAHVNAEFGKGSGNPTFAYTFPQGLDTNYGVDYMWSAISNLIKYAEYDVETSATTGTPTFVQGQTEADAVSAITGLWEKLLEYGCGVAGAPIENGLNPNAPP